MRRMPTPILVPRTVPIAVALFLATLLVYVMVAVPAVPRILFGGFVLAMFLWYPLRWLERRLPRRAAILVLVFLALGLSACALLLLIPPLLDQLRALVTDAPELATRANDHLTNVLTPLADAGLLPNDADSVARDLQAGLVARVQAAADGLLSYSLGAIAGGLGVVVQTLGVTFVGISLLVDERRLRALVVRAAPRRYRRDILELFSALGEALSRYLLSLLLVALAQGISAAIFLGMIGVPYSLLLSACIAATSTIPYIGTWFGGGPAILLAALQSPLAALLTFIAFFATTTVIGNMITPRIQGAAVGVHPVLVLLGVVAAGGLFGLLGVFLAVPTLAVVRVLGDFLRVRVRVRTT